MQVERSRASEMMKLYQGFRLRIDVGVSCVPRLRMLPMRGSVMIVPLHLVSGLVVHVFLDHPLFNNLSLYRCDLSQLNLSDRRIPAHILLWALIHVKPTPAFLWPVHHRSVARNCSVAPVPVPVFVDVDVDAFLLAWLYGSILNRR